MPTDSPRLIPVPRESLARVLLHAASRAHSDPAEARAWEALQAALDDAAKRDTAQPIWSWGGGEPAKPHIDAVRFAIGIEPGSNPPRFSTFAIHDPRPTTVGALVDALRADMDRLGVVSLHAHPYGVDIVLRREG